MSLSYSKRAEHCKNALAKKLFHLIETKKTNLAFSADVTHCRQLLDLADKLGPEICILKTHVDILSDFTSDFTKNLLELAHKHSFLIFEDRKFADIGSTVKNQYAGGIYRIADWADIINAHSLPGPGIIQGLSEASKDKQRGLLLLAEMSSAHNLFTAEYANKTCEMAQQFKEFVIGFISQRKLSPEPQWIYMTPGVQFSQSGDSLGQQYITPEQAILNNGSDIIIVGRGIMNASDPLDEAKKYRAAGWAALRHRA